VASLRVPTFNAANQYKVGATRINHRAESDLCAKVANGQAKGEKSMEPLKELNACGQSAWLDNVSRSLIRSGKLSNLIANGVRGVTSNPAIFEKAIAHSNDYDQQIAELARDKDANAILRILMIDDIKAACDVLLWLYEETDGRDGFVSVEVSPNLADDTLGTIVEAQGLWQDIDRPNVLIKVPATEAGIPAIKALISDGVNVNATLLFSRDMYAKVALAYIAGLEALPRSTNLSKIASAASFFISRIDNKVDSLLSERIDSANGAGGGQLGAMKGKTAIANAKLAFQLYRQIYGGARWAKLARRGARPQRLLWASTGTKDKSFSDVMYVEELVGPNTINTMPPDTLEAYRDHGKPGLRLEVELAEAGTLLASLEQCGVSLDQVTAELLADGLARFKSAAESLVLAIDQKRRAALTVRV
jgi:transaldolase/glucose-6-phosphate isomerase